jgi:hypothetical protein
MAQRPVFPTRVRAFAGGRGIERLVDLNFEKLQEGSRPKRARVSRVAGLRARLDRCT